MPDKQAPPKGKGKGAQKEVAGLPVWMWGVGALVLVGGFLYLRSHSGSSASSGQQASGTGQGGMHGAYIVGGGSPTGLSAEQLLLLIEDMQHSRGHRPKPKPKPKRDDDDHRRRRRRRVNPGGPDRR